ncbi:helix-turn-helix domain-containing protein [Dyadobacter aurulentus]|uniref:helix-turn-helix domain-containing protein n=1 Tax=Dyadobacter sp. UC 10 TaxID=2605428 RepID=UPI0011F381ED|nr:AraC family transcriptional regulator [Dyadobacter sp. UC 10]KAA0993358.1 AraC family transcriptional regulator [Dyadobacter sp. UC 10]
MREIFDPIRDHYTFAQPCCELADHIDFFSESVVNGFEFTVEMFPSWTPTMYINLGSTYRISLNNSAFAIDRDMDILVLRDLHTTRHNLAGDRIFTIKFKPGGLEAILGISQVHMKGKVIPLRFILPMHLIEQLKNSLSFATRSKIMEEYLIAKHEARLTDHYLTFVQDLTETYQNTHLQLNVSQLAEKHFVTPKSVNRYFHRVIGISPKGYFSILRARTALTAYVKREEFDPAKFGYYDSSHFYREAAKFTGVRLG